MSLLINFPHQFGWLSSLLVDSKNTKLCYFTYCTMIKIIRSSKLPYILIFLRKNCQTCSKWTELKWTIPFLTVFLFWSICYNASNRELQECRALDNCEDQLLSRWFILQRAVWARNNCMHVHVCVYISVFK